jgi:hypothetical protein
MTDQHGGTVVHDRKRRNFGGASVVYMTAFFLALLGKKAHSIPFQSGMRPFQIFWISATPVHVARIAG